MGECGDFHVGETVVVTVPFDPPHRLSIRCGVTYVWDEFIDVPVGDAVIRFPRHAFDCAGLEGGRPCIVDVEAFEEHFAATEYDPESEAQEGDDG